MTLNKAKGRMFKSVGWTWNPIAGCTHGCLYCWAKRMCSSRGQDFEPKFREYYFKDKMPNDGSWIFVGSMGDTFCDGVPDEWIYKLFMFIKRDKSNNKFLLQTKNPGRLNEFYLDDIKDKIILGTTLETCYDTSIYSKAPQPYHRAIQLIYMKTNGYKTFLSLEPLADFDVDHMFNWITKIKPEAIEIGLENYSNYTPKPPEHKINELLFLCHVAEIPVVLKDNLSHLEQPTVDSQQLRKNVE